MSVLLAEVSLLFYFFDYLKISLFETLSSERSKVAFLSLELISLEAITLRVKPVFAVCALVVVLTESSASFLSLAF